MKKGTAKKSLTKGKQAKSAKPKKAASVRAGKSAAASTKKKSAVAKTAKSTAPAKKAKTAAPKSGQSAASNSQPLVPKQPQSKQQAALQHGMFLYTDDAWSQAYFNNNDLHSVERALFG